jgi:FMN phosphatase YigB (HAD superfamily)
VTAHLGVDPAACVFVDDRAVNVDAARAFGMRALRFEGCADALERGLLESGLEF